jgi:hypothetical protein
MNLLASSLPASHRPSDDLSHQALIASLIGPLMTSLIGPLMTSLIGAHGHPFAFS